MQCRKLPNPMTHLCCSTPGALLSSRALAGTGRGDAANPPTIHEERCVIGRCAHGLGDGHFYITRSICPCRLMVNTAGAVCLAISLRIFGRRETKSTAISSPTRSWRVKKNA